MFDNAAGRAVRCGLTMPPGAQFVAGFGKHMASSFKQYIEDNRAMLTEADNEDLQSATG